jgi:ubiquinone/menaquinone biosynthesis C-methylase UbiE
MATASSRYERVAGWYAEFTRDWGTEAWPLLPEDLNGQRVLDLACGLGQLGQELADRGAQVTAVDVSEPMLRLAADADPPRGSGVQYVHGDAAGVDWWDGEPFDGVVCSMALMDIADLGGALATAAAVLEPGGWLSVSLLHPCFPGLHTESSTQLSSWPPERGYTSEGWWTTGSDGVRGRVGAHHRMLSTYLNALLDAGFFLEEFAESDFPIPRYLLVRCRRVTTAR